MRRCPRGLWCDPAKVVVPVRDPVVRIHPLSLRDGLDPSGFEVDMKTLITFQRYDKNLNFYKGICSANYNNFDSKYTNIASLQAGSYGVFPKSAKETPKICLVY